MTECPPDKGKMTCLSDQLSRTEAKQRMHCMAISPHLLPLCASSKNDTLPQKGTQTSASLSASPAPPSPSQSQSPSSIISTNDRHRGTDSVYNRLFTLAHTCMERTYLASVHALQSTYSCAHTSPCTSRLRRLKRST